MTHNNKVITAMTSGITAVALATGVTIGVLTPEKTEIPYEINVVSPYVSEISVDIPEKESIGLYELYLNDELVDRNVIPDTIQTIPLVLSNTDNLSFKFYQQGKCVATGEFEEDKLYFKK